MRIRKAYDIPARTAPGSTRSALPLMTQGGSVKLTMGRGSACQGSSIPLRIGSVNVGSLRGRDGEVVNMAVVGQMDFCCLQETRWRGEGARRLGAYKLFWMGCEKGIHGVGVLVADRWIEKVLDVKRVSERLMVVRVIVGRSVLNLVSVYAPQMGRSRVEKEEFLVMLREVVSGIDSDERMLICGDLNGHVGSEIDGFESVHGGFGFGKRNVEGEMILETADALDLAVLNTWFRKNEERLFTYENGECRTVVDYILSRKSERKMVRDVKVVRVECIKQHRLLLCIFDLKEGIGTKSKVKPVKRCKVWKLKEVETKAVFNERVQVRADLLRKEPGDVDKVWRDMKACLLEEAVEVCGETRARYGSTKRDLVVECRDCGLSKGEAALIQALERA